MFLIFEYVSKIMSFLAFKVFLNLYQIKLQYNYGRKNIETVIN